MGVVFQIDDLERDAFEVLRLIRSLKNTFAPINRIPPEVLTLIPDWNIYNGEQCAITLSHVCRAWRESFISRASLWSHFYCVDTDKTRVYFKRSKSSPIDMWLDRTGDLSPHDPLFLVIPHATGRLKYLYLHATSKALQGITAHLSHPAPLLKYLSIGGDRTESIHNPVLSTALFNGGLSSLHELYLQYINTELPWRGMVNLTSFSLGFMQGIPIRQLLDFFESAPRLREIRLRYATLTPGAQAGRLVSLACLEEMDIRGNEPCSLLLDHLLIPVGAELETRIDLPGDRVEGHLPDSLDNLRNLSNFTKVSLWFGESYSDIQFTGPNGQVSMASKASVPGVNLTCPTLEYLAQFDTSKTEWLELYSGDPISPGDRPYQVLPPMQNLRTLVLSRCDNLYDFTSPLQPSLDSSKSVVCPKLEKLVLDLSVYEDKFEDNLQSVIEMAALRASRGVKLNSVVITNGKAGFTQINASDLKKHVSYVEFDGSDDDGSDDRSNGRDEGG